MVAEYKCTMYQFDPFVSSISHLLSYFLPPFFFQHFSICFHFFSFCLDTILFAIDNFIAQFHHQLECLKCLLFPIFSNIWFVIFFHLWDGQLYASPDILLF